MKRSLPKGKEEWVGPGGYDGYDSEKILCGGGDRTSASLAGPRIGMGPLPADRHTSTVSQTPITPEIHQPFNIHRDLAAQIALDPIFVIDDLADAGDLIVVQRIHPHRPGHAGLFADLYRPRATDPMNISQGNSDRPVGKVDT